MQSTLPAKSTRQSKARDPRSVVLERVAGGNFAALSSNGQDWYTVTRSGDGWQCECRGYLSRQTCCHSLAAALPRCFWCLSTVEVETFVNGADNDSAIQLCGACVTAKIPDNCAEHPAGCGDRHSA